MAWHSKVAGIPKLKRNKRVNGIRDWKIVTCSVSTRYFHTYLMRMRVSKNAWNSHRFGRRGRDAVSMFFEALQRTKGKICCCKVIRVLQWLAGFMWNVFTTF